MLDHRPAELEDLSAVCQFVQTPDELFYAFPKATWPLTPEQMAAALESRQHSTLVLRRGEAVAFANFFRWEHGGCCHLGNVMVSPSARRSGVAQYLLDVMEALARKHYSATTLQAACFNPNTPALLLYTRQGFRPLSIEERVNPAGQRVALLHLQKKL
ncbi:acetyltransferase (GNAT) family protein [Pseudomonas duriflava]|uniref:Acetyltransferase (GNAT) family protein n=1 Tax=Pseudomonas duriflava TaxID=459528 RepID=A0A562QCE9_9PSED|nr:GNAT family N-acetyltransferase [Pseudomonas duriflava]TWI54389.1 acetyltransferase (GNAT) family protein [Pseudomonas duriflava]